MLVAQAVESTEEDHKWDVLLYHIDLNSDALVEFSVRGDIIRPVLLSLHLDGEQLRWFVRVFCLRTDLGHPGVFGRGLLVEDIDLVVGHTLLSHNDLFTAVYNEVASLIKPAVLAVLHSFVLVQAPELTEVRPQHDWDLANKDTGIFVLEDDVLDFALSLACLGTVVVVVVEFFLAKLDVCVQLSGVCQVPHPGLMGEHRHHTVVCLHDSWHVVHMDLAELDFVDDVLVGVPLLLSRGVLWHFLDLDLTVLEDNVLHVELQESVEAADLL